MAHRIVVPHRVRFEVFKRDKFTCQYCGRAAPSIVLHTSNDLGFTYRSPYGRR